MDPIAFLEREDVCSCAGVEGRIADEDVDRPACVVRSPVMRDLHLHVHGRIAGDE